MKIFSRNIVSLCLLLLVTLMTLGITVAGEPGDVEVEVTTLNEAATDGTATDGTATDGTATDGTATDGTVPNQESIDKTVPDQELDETKQPTIDFSVWESEHRFFSFIPKSENADYLTYDFGDGNHGRSIVVPYMSFIDHRYENSGIFQVKFTAHNPYGTDSKTIGLYINPNGGYKVLPEGVAPEQ